MQLMELERLVLLHGNIVTLTYTETRMKFKSCIKASSM